MRALEEIARRATGERELNLTARSWLQPYAPGELSALCALWRMRPFLWATPYVPDPPDARGRDWVRDPCLTLREGGDCDDLAVLWRAALAIYHVPSRIVWVPLPAQSEDHVSIQVRVEEGARWSAWLWCEPIAPGAALGEHPIDAVERAQRNAREPRELPEIVCDCGRS